MLSQRLLDKWTRLNEYLRTHWRWLGYVLTAAALVYLLSILFYGGTQIKAANWQAYGTASLTALMLYLLSLLIQFFIWTRLIAFHRRADWRDVEIYSRMILTRRLPGGVWHWLSRIAMYSATTDIPSHIVLLANFLEWSLLILVALGVFTAGVSGLSLGLRLILTALFIAMGIGLAYRWQSTTLARRQRVVEASLWTGLYGVAWFLGGTILYLFVRAGGADQLSWLEAFRLWSLAGGISLFITLVPATFGVQEVTLTLILQAYLPLPTALLVAMLIRLVFTLADILWGTLGWALSVIMQWIRSHRSRQADLPHEVTSIASPPQA